MIGEFPRQFDDAGAITHIRHFEQVSLSLFRARTLMDSSMDGWNPHSICALCFMPYSSAIRNAMP